MGLSHDTGQVTHHIGPYIDAERDLLMHDLREAGMVNTFFQISGTGPTSVEMAKAILTTQMVKSTSLLSSLRSKYNYLDLGRLDLHVGGVASASGSSIASRRSKRETPIVPDSVPVTLATT